jgi:hypothetical protein
MKMLDLKLRGRVMLGLIYENILSILIFNKVSNLR